MGVINWLWLWPTQLKFFMCTTNAMQRWPGWLYRMKFHSPISEFEFRTWIGNLLRFWLKYIVNRIYIASFTIWPSLRQFMDSSPKELFIFWGKPLKQILCHESANCCVYATKGHIRLHLAQFGIKEIYILTIYHRWFDANQMLCV